MPKFCCSLLALKTFFSAKLLQPEVFAVHTEKLFSVNACLVSDFVLKNSSAQKTPSTTSFTTAATLSVTAGAETLRWSVGGLVGVRHVGDPAINRVSDHV